MRLPLWKQNESTFFFSNQLFQSIIVLDSLLEILLLLFIYDRNYFLYPKMSAFLFQILLQFKQSTAAVK